MHYMAFFALQVAAGASFSCPGHLNVDHRIKETPAGWVAVNAQGRSAPLANVTIFDGDPSAGRSIAPLVQETKNGFYLDYVIGASANGTGIRCEYAGTADTDAFRAPAESIARLTFQAPTPRRLANEDGSCR